MKLSRSALGLALLASTLASESNPAPAFRTDSSAVVVAPGVISTPASEVRIALSPDGRRALWGAIDRSGGPGGWDIFESTRSGSAWGPARPVSFDSPANDFDPAFAPDGLGVYFFSNRAGGLGGDDIYFVSFDPASGTYGAAVNLGTEINSPKDEWAPAVSGDGAALLFASDGRGGKGKHDLFTASRASGSPGWSNARNLAEVNTAEEDLDATYLDDGGGRSLVLTSGELEGTVALYYAPFVDGRYGPRQKLGGNVNLADVSSFGPAVSDAEPGVLYFNSRRPEGPGRQDIFSVRYAIVPPAGQ
jgi:hypothetical protein